MKTAGICFLAFLATVRIAAGEEMTPVGPHATSPTFAVDASALTDFIIPDVCVDGADRAVAADPYACPKGTTRRNLRVGEEIPYVLEKTRKKGTASTVYITYPAADGSGNVYEVELFDNKGTVRPKGAGSSVTPIETGLWDLDVAGDTYGVIRWHGGARTYSSVETRGKNGPNGWFSRGCSAADSWVQFPKSFVPFAEPNKVYAFSDFTIRNVKYSNRITPEQGDRQDMFLLPPMSRRADGLYRGDVKLCDNEEGYSKSRAQVDYGSIAKLRYESGKVMDSIYEEHFYSDPSEAHEKRNDHLGMEEDYYTREYGNSRWETWLSGPAIQGRCESRADGDEATEKCVAAKTSAALRGDGCPNSGETTRMVHDVLLYRVSCSDRTTVEPIPNSLAKVPVQPRVYHLSRELFGANQNWIANPDFAGGFDTGWKPSEGTVSIVGRAPVTNSAQLQLQCSPKSRCAVTTTRILLSTDDDPYGTSEVMMKAERDQLTWLTALDAGVTLFSKRAADTHATLRVSVVGEGDRTVAARDAAITLRARQTARIKLKMPFTHDELAAAQRFVFTVELDSGRGIVALDDAYLFPDNPGR